MSGKKIPFEVISIIFWSFVGLKYMIPTMVDPYWASAIEVGLVAAMAVVITSYTTFSRKAKKEPIQSPSLRLVGIWVLFCGLTLLWSVSDNLLPDVMYFINLLSIYMIVTRLILVLDMQTFISTMKYYFYGLTVTGVYALLFVGKEYYGTTLVISSETLHKNTIGELSAMIVIYFTLKVLMKGSRMSDCLCILIGLVLTLGTGSKTSVAGLLFTLLVAGILYFLKNGLSKRVVIVAVGFLIFITASFDTIANQYSQYAALSNGEAMATISGRTFIWEYAYKLIDEKLLVGHGYLSADNIFGYFFADQTKIVHAHNEVINLMLEVGLLGTVLILAVYVITLCRYLVFCWMDFRFESLLLFCILICFGVRGIAEIVFSHGGERVALFITAMLFLEKHIQQRRASDGYAKHKGVHRNTVT